MALGDQAVVPGLFFRSNLPNNLQTAIDFLRGIFKANTDPHQPGHHQLGEPAEENKANIHQPGSEGADL